MHDDSTADHKPKKIHCPSMLFGRQIDRLIFYALLWYGPFLYLKLERVIYSGYL